MKTLKSAIESSRDHILITNKDGVVLLANSSVTNTTGYSNTELIGVKAGKLWGGQMEDSFYERMWDKILNKKEIYYGELKNQRKNGDIYYAFVKIIPVLDTNTDVKYFIGVERDVTHIIEDFGGIPPESQEDLKRFIGEELNDFNLNASEIETALAKV